MAVLNEARIMIMLPTETIHHAGLSALPGHDAAGTAHRPKGTAEHAMRCCAHSSTRLMQCNLTATARPARTKLRLPSPSRRPERHYWPPWLSGTAIVGADARP